MTGLGLRVTTVCVTCGETARWQSRYAGHLPGCTGVRTRSLCEGDGERVMNDTSRDEHECPECGEVLKVIELVRLP